MLEGKIGPALKLLSDECNGNALSLDSHVTSDTTGRESLKEKHPKKKPLNPMTVIRPEDCPNDHHPVIFESLNGQLIHRTALKTNGSAGPSGVDSAGWRRLCSFFQYASKELCSALAAVARRICTSYIDLNSLKAFVASRLIALDKCPGIRPIRVGEVVRRIIGKAILTVISEDIQTAAGSRQLCAGQKAGCEAAVHAMRNIFEDGSTEGILLVDASNAFNNLNREAALHNILLRCPSLATVLINTYRENIDLYIGGETILSEEGTTQGDPLAMVMYTIGNANAKKTWLIVKEEHYNKAQNLFSDTEVQITIEGKRHLGAPLGTPTFIESYVHKRVEKWVQEIEKLSTIAMSQPHAAYAAFTHGLGSKWNYLVRCIPGINDLLEPVEAAIRLKFIPTLTGRNAINDMERQLLALPVREGGLNIINPTKTATIQLEASTKISAPIVALLIQQTPNYTPSVKNLQEKTTNGMKKQNRKALHDHAEVIYNELPKELQRAVNLARQKGASNWLTALPIAEHGFALHKGAFRDAICLRYGWKPIHLPSTCVCGKSFSLDHALSCPCGSFPSLRHNEIRDVTADLMNEVCHNVSTEPHLQPLSGESLRFKTSNRQDQARLDIKAQGFWGDRHQCAFFDVRVFNPLAQTHQNKSLSRLFDTQEKEKRRTYEQRVREVELGSFTPLVFSATGGMAKSATITYQCLASLLAEKRDLPYSQVIGWLRCRISFSLIRSAIMCIRGSRQVNETQYNMIDLALHEARISRNI